MALAFPLSLAAFADVLKVQALAIELGGAVEQSRTAAGQQFTASLGARLWTGHVTLAPSATATVAAMQAALHRLTDPDASFLVGDWSQQYPAYDPTGSILGAASVTINALVAGNRELKLIGLPNGYKIQPGDYLSFTYGSAPLRYAYHQVVTGATSTGAGIATTNIEVMPPIRPGAVTGAAVVMKQPRMKAVIEAGSLSARTARAVISEGLSFRFVQTLG